MATVNISTGTGDCQGDSSGTFSSTGTTLAIGSTSADGRTTKAWMPFTVNIGKGIYVASATLRVIAAVSRSATTVKIKVGCEAADSPSTPTTWADLNGRTLSTAFTTDNNVVAMTAGTEYTWSVTSAVQEILNRAGWASGNTMAILIQDNGSTADVVRTLAANENVSYTEPILQIVTSAGTQVIMC